MATIDALLGIGDLTEEERMRTMADQLRGRKRAADVFALSTVKPIAQAAQAEQASVLEAAQTAGGLRQRALTRASQEERDRLNREQRQAEFDQNQANWQATFDQNKRDKALDRQNKYDVAKLKKMASGERKITRKELEDLRSVSNAYNEQATVLGSYKPEYSGGGWGGRPAANLAARFTPQLIGEESKDAARWWSEYQRFHEAVLRHELFGAALTGTEKQNWKDMTISPNMTDEMIQDRLERQKTFLDNKARNYIETQAASNMPDELINTAFGRHYPHLYGKAGTASDFLVDYTTEPAETDTSVVPEGVDKTEWDALSEEDKLFYLENM